MLDFFFFFFYILLNHLQGCPWSSRWSTSKYYIGRIVGINIQKISIQWLLLRFRESYQYSIDGAAYGGQKSSCYYFHLDGNTNTVETGLHARFVIIDIPDTVLNNDIFIKVFIQSMYFFFYYILFKDRQQSTRGLFVFRWFLPEFLRYDYISYIIWKVISFSIQWCKPLHNHIWSIKNALEKLIFSLLFFQHGYLSNQSLWSLEILTMYWKHSDLVNCVSEFFLLRTYFLFYDKKRETFIVFFLIIFLDFECSNIYHVYWHY